MSTFCLEDKDPNFVETYSNASHEWILHYSKKQQANIEDRLRGLTKETYVTPNVVKQGKGRRKELLQKFYTEVITEEVMRELEDKAAKIEPYESEYSDEFTPSHSFLAIKQEAETGEKCDRPEQMKDEEGDYVELCQKYPLYNSPAFTFYNQRYGHEKRDPFKKLCQFTKTVDEVFNTSELPSYCQPRSFY